jgi:hypothetical protein
MYFYGLLELKHMILLETEKYTVCLAMEWQLQLVVIVAILPVEDWQLTPLSTCYLVCQTEME